MSDPAAVLPEGAQSISVAGFDSHAGPFYRLAADGETRRYAFVAEPRHMNASGSIHGGMLMTFADVAMSQSACAASGAKSRGAVSLNCDFVGLGQLGDLVEARVRVSRQTRALVFLTADIVAGGRALMVASGLWKIV